jgi:hypothetical protein
MVAPVKVEWDEKPVSEGGKVTISGYDPYAKDNVWTAKDSAGDQYSGAEVTSEGFHIFGLDPYQYYSAGLACYLIQPTERARFVGCLGQQHGSDQCAERQHHRIQVFWLWRTGEKTRRA